MNSLPFQKVEVRMTPEGEVLKNHGDLLKYLLAKESLELEQRIASTDEPKIDLDAALARVTVAFATAMAEWPVTSATGSVQEAPKTPPRRSGSRKKPAAAAPEGNAAGAPAEPTPSTTAPAAATSEAPAVPAATATPPAEPAPAPAPPPAAPAPPPAVPAPPAVPPVNAPAPPPAPPVPPAPPAVPGNTY